MYRDDSCAHVRLVEGRCFISQSEVIVSTATLERLKVKIGGTLEVSAAA